MKKSEIFVLLAGTIITFIFVGYMFNYYLRIEEAQMIRDNIHYDSLIIEEQKQLKKNDSIIQIEIRKESDKVEHELNNHHSFHNKRVNKLMQKFDSLRKK